MDVDREKRWGAERVLWCSSVTIWAKAAKGKGKRGRKRKGATLEAEEAVNKVRRGRKRKSAVLEAEAEAEEPEEPEPEPKTKIARTNKALALSRASVIQTPITEDEIVLEP